MDRIPYRYFFCSAFDEKLSFHSDIPKHNQSQRTNSLSAAATSYLFESKPHPQAGHRLAPRICPRLSQLIWRRTRKPRSRRILRGVGDFIELFFARRIPCGENRPIRPYRVSRKAFNSHSLNFLQSSCLLRLSILRFVLFC